MENTSIDTTQTISERSRRFYRIKQYFTLPSMYFTPLLKKGTTGDFRGGVWSLAKNKGHHMTNVFEVEDKNKDLQGEFTEELSGKTLIALFLRSIFGNK